MAAGTIGDVSSTDQTTAPAPEDPDGAPPPPRDRRTVLWAALTVALIGLVAVLLIVGLTNRGVSTTIDDAIARGERAEAPEFTLPLLVPGAPLTAPEGTEVSLSDLRGRPVVLNIWASWCDPCKDEAPVIRDIATDYAPQGVVVLGLNVRDLSGKGRAFAQRYGLTFPSVRDGEGRVQNRFGATGVPETFVIDREGRVALALRGPLVDRGRFANVDDFRRVLDQVVAERPGAGPSGGGS